MTVPSGQSHRRAGPILRWAATAGLALGLFFAGSSVADERPVAPGDLGSPGEANTSPAARQVTAWVLETADNQGLPFVIIDKVDARVFVFDHKGQLLGTAAVLLGLERGDISPPGIGDRPLSTITPEERITPAGRFQASMGENLGGKGILWIDYDAALSLHPVVTTRAADRRLQRLATAAADDNRISYGCVNVPVRFFNEVVQPAFNGTTGVVYILPETRSLADVFFPGPGIDPSGPGNGGQPLN